ncbi:hypothetical protein CHU98_g4125 [Xylaria longipes]|nr:hypothetical protein CHU98_g4125 [Xylaria longipes]
MKLQVSSFALQMFAPKISVSDRPIGNAEDTAAVGSIPARGPGSGGPESDPADANSDTRMGAWLCKERGAAAV